MGKRLWLGAVRHKRGVFAFCAVVYVLSNMLVGSRLSFFWDDWDAIEVARTRPMAGIFSGHFGHFAPISKALFALQTQLFGSWYPGYVAVNAVIVVVICYLMLQILKQCNWIRMPWAVFGVIVYSTSVGVLIHVDTATNAGWLLTLAFATFALRCIFLNKPIWIVLLFLLLSWGSLASVYLPVASFVSAVLIICLFFQEWDPATRRRRAYLTAAVILSAPPMSAIANWLAVTFSDGMGIDGAEPALGLSNGSLSALMNSLPLFFSWIVTPISVLLSTSTSAVVTLAVAISAHLGILLAGLALGILALLLILRRSMQTDGKSVLPGLILWIPVFVMAVAISVLRSSTMYSLRYMEVWLLPAVLAVGSVVSQRYESLILSLLRRLLAGLLVATACVSVILFPSTLSHAANIDRQRMGAQLDAKWSAEECVAELKSDVQARIAPSSTRETLCASWAWLNEETVAGKILR